MNDNVIKLLNWVSEGVDDNDDDDDASEKTPAVTNDSSAFCGIRWVHDDELRSFACQIISFSIGRAQAQRAQFSFVDGIIYLRRPCLHNFEQIHCTIFLGKSKHSLSQSFLFVYYFRVCLWQLKVNATKWNFHNFATKKFGFRSTLHNRFLFLNLLFRAFQHFSNCLMIWFSTFKSSRWH